MISPVADSFLFFGLNIKFYSVAIFLGLISAFFVCIFIIKKYWFSKKERNFLKISEKVLTSAFVGAIMYRQCGSPQRSQYAGMAELADARDLKSREILSRTGSTPASGTIISRSGAVW